MGDRDHSPAPWGRGAWFIGAAACAPALLCAAVGWLDPVGFAAQPSLLLVNAMPLWLAWLLLLAGTRRALWSAALVSVLLAALQAINARKMVELDIPLLPSDLATLPQVLASSSLYLRYVEVPWWGWLLLPAALAYRFEPAWRARKATRPALAAFAAVGLVSLALGWAPWVHLYETFAPPFQPWATMATVRTQGSLAYFVRAGWQDRGACVPPTARGWPRSGSGRRSPRAWTTCRSRRAHPT